MRNKRRILLLSLVAIPVIGLTVVFAQPGGFRSSRGGGMDPNQIFNRYSGGQDFIEVNNWITLSNQRDPSSGERIQAFLQQQGITNGRVTREQFAVYIQQRMAAFSGAAPGAPPSSAPGAPPGTTPGAPQAAQALQINEDDIRDSFRRRDRNGDNVLDQDEMPGSLRAELDKWDKNKNGKIEYDEYREYYIARMQARSDQGGNNDPRNGQQQNGNNEFQQTQQPEEQKNLVYRHVEDLPKELPPWFKQIRMQFPKGNPGQIALYEWKNSDAALNAFGDKMMATFRDYDRNSDGFITVEEVLAFQQRKSGPSYLRDNNGGNQEGEQAPKEETLLVIAGPGANSDDAVAVAASTDPRGGFPGGSSFNRGSYAGGSTFNRGSSRGGPPSGYPSTGGFDRSKMGQTGGTPGSSKSDRGSRDDTRKKSK